MKRLSEETLNAYADDMLDASARAEVEAQLKTDARARRLLEKLRRADRLAVEVLSASMREPPPQALVDTVLKIPREGAAADRASPQEAWRSRSWSVRDYVFPLAACFLLAAGIGAGLLLGRQAARSTGGLELGMVVGESALHRLLESHPSGDTVEIAGAQKPSRHLSVVATFKDRHARSCREVEVLQPDANRQAIAAGVACRNGAGQWVVEGLTRLANSPSAAGQQFEPAGVPEKDALEGLLTMLGAQRALDPAEELSLIERRWKN